MLLYVFLTVSIIILLRFEASTYLNDSCIGVICGNKMFNQDIKDLNMINRKSNVKILVYTVWVADTPLDTNRLNHKLYCDANGYDYRHYSMTPKEFGKKSPWIPPAWLNVIIAKELLDNKTESYDYYVKLDIDCIFTRFDVRLESLIDPLERYSFYISETTPESRFTQSHAWILKNSDFGRLFITEWLEYRYWGYCGNIAYEQGALHMVIGYLMNRHYGKNVTEFNCMRHCGLKLRSAYAHHHCVLDWYTDNGFGKNGKFIHPDIYLIPFPEGRKEFISPDDGFSFQVESLPKNQINRPLTIHPCKKGYYLQPDEVMSNIDSVCQFK